MYYLRKNMFCSKHGHESFKILNTKTIEKLFSLKCLRVVIQNITFNY